MDAVFARFYSSLDPAHFKYFARDDCFYVYKSDISLISSALLPDDIRARTSSGAVKLSEIDHIIRDLLLVQRVPVEEYSLNSHGEFELTRSGYPSSYADFADICLSSAVEPSLCAATALGCEVGFAVVNNGIIKTTSFADDDLYSGLYALVNVYNCTEMLYADQHLERICMGWGVVATGVANCGSAAVMLQSYLRKRLTIETFVRTDACLVNIKDFDLADFGCATAQGARLLGQWMRAPCVDPAEINNRLDLAEAFTSIELCLKGCSDMKRLAARVLNRRITIQECVRTYQMVNLIPGYIEAIRRGMRPEYESLLTESFISPLENVYGIFGPFLAEVRNKINLETGRIISSLTEELMRLNAERNTICSEIEEEFLGVRAIYPRAKYQAKAFKVPRTDYVPEEFDRRRYVVLSVLKTGVAFLTAPLASRRNALADIESEISAEEGKVFEVVRTGMLTIVNSLEIYNFLLALMDIYKVFSLKCMQPSYSRPMFKEGEYQVSGFFHPLLEHKDVVLNDLLLDSGDSRRLCILTGPNMGGKSTVLKSLSMVSLYAQIGCYVPAERAVLPIFDKIFMRIGARDHGSAGLSTFMVEMLDLARILKLATGKSLILIDELGRGTAALDGLSLVSAVKEHIVELGAYTVMATHFSELGDGTTFNFKMAVSGNLVTYRLEPGVADHSFGLNVALQAGFPDSVVDSAKRYLQDTE